MSGTTRRTMSDSHSRKIFKKQLLGNLLGNYVPSISVKH